MRLKFRNLFLLAVVLQISIVTFAACGVNETIESPGEVTSDPDNPDLPIILEGYAQINGNPAPAGTAIEAKLGGELEGKAEVQDAGKYKIYVNFKPDEFKNIKIFVNGKPANLNLEDEDLQAVAESSGNYLHANVIQSIDTPSAGGGGGGSGGGGGGGAVSPESLENVELRELTKGKVLVGHQSVFEFRENPIVMYVKFDPKKSSGDLAGVAEVLKGKSELVSDLPPGEVYKHFNIWIGYEGFTSPINIENLKVGFRVGKAWIKDANIEKATISLCLFEDEEWKFLPTELIKEDAGFLYFEAETSDFSCFAITGTPIKILSPEADAEENFGSEDDPGKAIPEASTGPGKGITIAAFLMLGVIIGAAILKRDVWLKDEKK